MEYLRNLSFRQIQGKTCVLRVDLNIAQPQNETFRIKAIIPTIKYLLKNKAKVVILSHRGRPQGREPNLSLKPFAKILSRLLRERVDFMGEIKALSAGRIFLLENLRFFPAEEKNNKQFAKKLASLGDIYINDAFAVSHRENASVAAITRFLPSYAGLLLEKEIKNLDSVMKNFKKPLIIILGGAKISDKIGLIKYFLKKADYFLLGGAIANTFFASQGLPVGDSLYEPKILSFISNLSTSDVDRLILPGDVVIHQRKILDIGPETIKNYQKIVEKAKTIIWNGPMGRFEDKRFAQGTEGIAKAIRQLADKKTKIIIGGGETITSLRPKTYSPRFAGEAGNLKPNVFLSTGGGAMLEYLAGKKLPGIAALERASLADGREALK